MTTRLNRREVLKGAVALAAGSMTGGSARPVTGAQSAVKYPEHIRVAIIGLEGHYSEILDAARVVPQIQVTALVEKSEALLKRVPGNALLKKAKIYQDYRELLDREALDVAAVCGENGARASIIQACAAKKIPIVAEKPLGLSLDELEKTRAAVTAAGVPLTILLPMRFYPQYQRMRSIVRSGEIGEVASLAAQKSYKLGERPAWMKDRKTFGGTIPYIGIHMVDLMIYVGGQDFKETAAFQSNVGFPQMGDMENNAAVVFRLANNGTASLRMDYLRPETAPTHGDDRLRIGGTKGIVEYQDGRDVMLMTSTRKPAPITDLPPVRSLFVDFLEALYGGRKHAISPEEVYRVNEIVLKAREAAETGRVVPL